MKDWMFLFLGLILAYLLDFTKPYITVLFTKGNQSWKQKRISNLMKDFHTVTALARDWKLSVIYVLIFSTSFLVFLLAVEAFYIGQIVIRGFHEPNLMTTSGYELRSVALYIFYLIFSFIFFSTYSYIMKIQKYDEYKVKTIKKLNKLGLIIEDLDKEEVKEEIIATPKKKQHRR